MELCVTLLDDFKHNTVKELKKKGMVVLDKDGKSVDNVEEILGDWSKVVSKKQTIPEKKFMCHARIWNNGYGARCSKIKNVNSEYCTQHDNHILKHGRLIYGKWRGDRETRYPGNFGRRSNKIIHWKGEDTEQSIPKISPRIQTQRKSRNLSSKERAARKIQAKQKKRKQRKRKEKKSRNLSSKERAAIKIQAVQKGRKVRKTQKKKKKMVSKLVDDMTSKAIKETLKKSKKRSSSYSL